MKKLLLTLTAVAILGIGAMSVGGAPIVPLSEEQIFAHVNAQNIVDSTIVITQTTLDQAGGWQVNGVFKPQSEWVQTSTKGTVRKNYAGVGYSYDKVRDVFIPPKSENQTIFDEEKAQWEAPPKTPTVWLSTTTPK